MLHLGAKVQGKCQLIHEIGTKIIDIVVGFFVDLIFIITPGQGVAYIFASVGGKVFRNILKNT